jgi:hypothetical protein
MVDRDGDGVPAAGVREGGYALASGTPVTGQQILRAEGLHTAIWPLHGYNRSDVFRAEGVSPLGHHSACGVLLGETTGRRSVFASLVYLGGAAPELRAGRFEVHDDGTRATASLTLLGAGGGPSRTLELAFDFPG